MLLTRREMGWWRFAKKCDRFFLIRWIARLIWRRQAGVCDCCGKQAGWSIISQRRFQYLECHWKRNPERFAASFEMYS